MLSKDNRHVGRLAPLGVGVVLVALIYFVSLGAVLATCVHFQVTLTTTDVALTPYRPLFRLLPQPFMQQYLRLCGLTDVEAFFIVHAMRSGSLKDVGVDAS